MTLNFEEYKTKLYSAVLADTLDSLGYHKQTLTPGIKSIKPDVIICGLARVGLYMPIYHDDENTNVYEHEISLIDSLNKSEIFILWCLAIPTLFFGFYPDPLINTIEVSISDLIDNYNFKIVSKQ